jgi:UDP-2,3-diacylglucosamine hydrolase
VLGHRLIVISDAHLGATPAAAEAALLAFLDAVPERGDALLLNGDLFDFWFAYRHAVPRRALPVVAALMALGRQVPIAVVGGNHDRWGSEFWTRDLGFLHGRRRLRVEVDGRTVLALHGDRLGDGPLVARLVQAAIDNPVTTGAFHALHPDLGLPLVRRLAPLLGARKAAGPDHDASALRQRAWAARLLASDPSVDTIVMGHTHRVVAEELQPGRWYLNPGAWFDGLRYGVVTGAGVELQRFSPAVPLPPLTAAHR